MPLCKRNLKKKQEIICIIISIQNSTVAKCSHRICKLNRANRVPETLIKEIKYLTDFLDVDALGQTRRNNTGMEYSGTGGATGDSPHSGRTSFFSKISSRFSKR